MKRVYLILLIISAVGILLFHSKVKNIGPTEKRMPSELINTEIEDFELRYLNNEIFRSSDHKGKIIVLDFFASWCGPCIKSIPDLNRIHKKYKDSSVMLLGIVYEDKEIIKGFVKDHNISYPIIMNPEKGIHSKFKIRAYPTVVIIDGEGIIREYLVGSDHNIEAKLKKLLKEKR